MESISDPGAALVPLSETIVETALLSHQRFETEKWQASEEAQVEVSGSREAPSYHNDSHIRSVTACSEHLFRAAAGGRDPFRLTDQLRLWNASHHSTPADLGTLAFACRIAFACHDLGNITRSAALLANGDGRAALDLAARYDSSTLYPEPAVEERSAAICESLLGRHLGDGDLIRTVRPLAHHLILQTVFHFEKTSSDEPFWLFMQTVDMVGSYYFSPVPRIRSVAGLFNEMRVQKDGVIRVVPFLTSLKERYEKLLPEASAREEALRIFEENACGQSRETVFAGAGSFVDYVQPMPFREAITLLLSGAAKPTEPG